MDVAEAVSDDSYAARRALRAAHAGCAPLSRQSSLAKQPSGTLSGRSALDACECARCIARCGSQAGASIGSAPVCRSDDDEDVTGPPADVEQPPAGPAVRPGERIDEEGNVGAEKTKKARPKLTYGHLTVRTLLAVLVAIRAACHGPARVSVQSQLRRRHRACLHARRRRAVASRHPACLRHLSRGVP